MGNEMSLYQAQEMAAASASAPTSNMLSTREAQEVQAAVFMAKRFPRDENAAMSRIMRACERKGLAAKATYSYPKGGTNVTGPSIRLAEAIAQSWGNIQSGVVELSQQEGESTCMAYCWDIETNTRECKIFTVKHQISTKNGMKVLTDPRDIYELVANQGARRKRACILNIIPSTVSVMISLIFIGIVLGGASNCLLSLCSTMWGRYAFTNVYGVVLPINQIVGSSGTILVAQMAARFSYTGANIIVGALALVGILLILPVKEDAMQKIEAAEANKTTEA